MKKKKKYSLQGMASLLLILGLTAGLLLPPIYSEAAEAESAVIGEGYVVVNADTGEVLLSKEENTRFYPASTTKIMTALLTIEKVENLDEYLAFSQWSVDSIPLDASTLEPRAAAGELMTVRNVLYGTVLASANECAAMLSEYISGSQEAFAELMNQKAVQLGCTDTHFVNAHGYHDDDHYSTPLDMAKIMIGCIQNDLFLEIDSTKTWTIPATNVHQADRNITMGHQMVLGNYDFPYAVAGKTGYTPEAGRCLVTYAVKDDIRLVCMVMKSTTESIYQDTDNLLTEAFSMMESRNLRSDGVEEGVNSTLGVFETIPGTVEENNSAVVSVSTLSAKTIWTYRLVIAAVVLSAIASLVLAVRVILDSIRIRKKDR